MDIVFGDLVVMTPEGLRGRREKGSRMRGMIWTGDLMMEIMTGNVILKKKLMTGSMTMKDLQMMIP